MAKFLGVGWGFPIQKDEATQRLALAVHEESIKQAIWIILSTAKGERVMRPDFGCGIHELVFAPNDATTRGLARHHVSEALRVWEPRIEVLDVTVKVAGAQGEALHIGIEYRVRTTDNRFNLVYPFYLQRGHL
ncbi:MAG: GPW/gp25 family protein [Xanthomonadales bacterium]|jgi:phage baseplate assembly protein W|nr:GPW/gp25 family protein [Xanthomonadales bacterium]